METYKRADLVANQTARFFVRYNPISQKGVFSMDYGMIGKIEKAKLYSAEPQRITFNSFDAQFHGNNSTYSVTLNQQGWHCSCPGFATHHICPHIMAMEKLFRPMLKREPLPYGPHQNVVSDVEKSKRYAEEKDRIQFMKLDVTFHGNNNDHHFGYDAGKWTCDCDFFHSRNICSHTMALERILHGMITATSPV